MLNKQHKPVQSLQRGLRLLEFIARRREGVILKELAREIGCSPPAAYHLVGTLVEAGFVKRLDDPVRYVLGERLLQMTQEQGKEQFYQRVEACMLALSRKLPQTSLFYVEAIGGSVMVRSILSAQQPERIVEGREHPLPPYVSAGSLAHLAFWHPEWVRECQTRYSFEAYGLAYWKSWEAFEEALEALRRDRFFLMPEPHPGALKMAVPLFLPRGGLAGSLTLHAHPARDGTPAPAKELMISAALEAAADFTQSLKATISE